MIDTFGKKIVLIAKEKFGSQKKMAEALNLAPSTISDWVNGRIKPSFEILKTMCLKADISLDYLVLGKSFETYAISPDIFNETYYHASLWSTQEKIPVNGTFFLGIYDLVIEEQKKGNKSSIKEIIEKLKPTILNLRK